MVYLLKGRISFHLKVILSSRIADFSAWKTNFSAEIYAPNNSHLFAYCKSNRLLIFELQTKKEIRFLLKKCMLKLEIILDRHGPGPSPTICLLPDPPSFSFPTTFNDGSLKFLTWTDLREQAPYWHPDARRAASATLWRPRVLRGPGAHRPRLPSGLACCPV